MGLGKGNVCDYVGRSEDLYSRLRSEHRKLKPDASIYVGRIVSSGIPGPNQMARDVPDDLDFAERLLVYTLQPTNNDNLKDEQPEECGVVMSRLFNAKIHDEPIALRDYPSKFPFLVAHYDPLKKPVLIRVRANQLTHTALNW